MKRQPEIMTLAVLALCVLATLGGTARAEDTQAVVRAQLPNGLRILIEEDHRLPIVSATIRYGVGSAMDPPGRGGLTSVVVQLIAHRTLHVPDGYGERLDRIGATWAYRTLPEAVEFQATVPSNRAALVAWLFSDQLGFFSQSVDAAAIDERLRTVRVARGQSADGAVAFANELAKEELAAHPYRRSGTEDGVDDLSSLSVADVRGYFNQWFVPSNTVLSFAGDITADDARALADRYFGPILAGDAPRAPGASPRSLRGEVHLDVEANVAHPMVVMSWPTPAQYAPGDAELDLVTHLLIGGRTAYLTWALVDQRKLASNVYAHQDSRRLGSTFTIRATAEDGHSAQEISDAIDGVLSQIQSSMINDDQRRGALSNALLPTIHDLASQPQRALFHARWLMTAGEPNFFDRDRERYEAVTAAQIRDAAIKFLPKDKRVVTFVTPTPDAPVRGRLSSRRATPGRP